MKTDKYVKTISKKLEDLLSRSSPSILKWDIGGEGSSTTTQQQEELDDIEIEKYGQPLRFADYRHARCIENALYRLA